MARRRPRPVRVLLPGEREGRRGFLKKGLFGAALLAAGGGGAWLATRKTRPNPALRPLAVFDAAQLTVILAIADRLVPEHPGFPRPAEIDVPAKVDAIAAMAHPASQKELRQLVSLFESGLSGLLDLSPRLFTECDAAAQDRRLRHWQNSRLAIRRTGFRALKRLVAAAYYASPESWAAVGYPGPPISPPPAARPSARPSTQGPAQPAGPAPAQAPSPSPPGTEDGAPPPRPRRFQPAPVPVEPVIPTPAPAEPVGPAPVPPGGTGGN